MSTGRQEQRAGQGSTQIQVSGDYIINAGISEERATEIVRAEAARLVAEYSNEARVVIEARLAELDKRVIPLLAKRDALASFGDPSFIKSYRKAQNSAAASDHSSDYDLLAGLLAERVANASQRHAVAGINRAMEVVDEMDGDALRALTAVHGWLQWSPSISTIEHGVNALGRVFEQVLDGALPVGEEWVEHLEMLGVVRRNDVSTFVKFDEHAPIKFPGMISVGVPFDQVPPHNLPLVEALPGFLIEHELKPGYVRVGAASETRLRMGLTRTGLPVSVTEPLIAFACGPMKLEVADEALKPLLASALRSRPSINTLAAWWDSLPNAVIPTAIGRSLATANALRVEGLDPIPR